MNITKTKSNTFLLDNTPPTCTITNNNNKLTIEAFDSNSMLSSKPFSWDNKNYQESNTLEIGSEKEYEAFVKDNVGNIGSCKIAISTLVSVPNTKLIINRNLYIVGMLLIISGLGITTYMIIKRKRMCNLDITILFCHNLTMTSITKVILSYISRSYFIKTKIRF